MQITMELLPPFILANKIHGLQGEGALGSLQSPPPPHDNLKMPKIKSNYAIFHNPDF